MLFIGPLQRIFPSLGCVLKLELSNALARVSVNLEQRRFRRPKYLKKNPPRRVVRFDSGDLLKQAPVDGNVVHYTFENVKELENAAEDVKKLFTLDFAEGEMVRQHRTTQIQRHIEEKLGVDCRLEKEIAVATIGIRNEMHHCLKFKKDTRAKARLIERIQKRKKKLKILRGLDFERFVWLLTELRIKYISPPQGPKDYTLRPTKKGIRREEVEREMAALKQQKFNELKLAFEKERADFEDYKKVTLEQVEADMKELGLTDKDVEKCINDSIVRPEPDVKHMNRLQRFFYEKNKEKKANEWRYVRETQLNK